MGIFGSWPLSTAITLAACVQSHPPPAQWQQPQQAPPPPYSQSSEAQPYPAPQPYPPYQQPYQPAPAQPAATYTPCQYMCGTMSRCQLHAYDACVTECRGTGAENTDNGRRVLDSFTRMTCEQLAAELRASNTTASTPAAPPTASPPMSPPAASPSSAVAAGRWSSAPHQSYTNPAYVSADFHLDVTMTSSGAFRGSWARYVCAGAAYAGVLSCGKGNAEGSVSGQLDPNGAGWIDLQGVGRSNLTWFASSASDVQLTLPQSWQGDKILYRSKIKR